MNRKTLAAAGILVLLGGAVAAMAMGQAGFTSRNGVPVVPSNLAGRPVLAGAWLFARECSVCHGADGQGSQNAPALNRPALYGAGADVLARFIQADMPADNPGILSGSDAQDLAAFVKTLGAGQGSTTHG